MKHFDVFNGDADGICALHQLRLEQPMEATLVTGAKRDVALLQRVEAVAAAGDSVTVLDVSLETNHAPLVALIDRGVDVEFFDHHYAGAVPVHALLAAHIDPAPDICTSLIVDRHLRGKHRLWAIAGAFGDNLMGPAHALAVQARLPERDEQQLRELGEAMNYNAYGDSEADLIVPPAALYRAVRPYADPFEFIATTSLVEQLADSRRRDMALAHQQRPAAELTCGSVYVLPDAAWSRRVRGAFANALANAEPQRAHAVLSATQCGDFTVSVRAPVGLPYGADRLCRSFATGGGRMAAGGINRLARERFGEFVQMFRHVFEAA